jgi:hypothetical protein
MNFQGIALGQIIISAQSEMRKAQAQLEVEEKGREVASLQGHIAGYKEIIANDAARFHLSEFMLEDTGEEPFKIPDLSDDDLETMRMDVETLTAREEWKEVLSKVELNIDSMKNSLLYCAESTRDLDICQGKYKGQEIFKSFFNSVESEVSRRAKEAEKKRKAPSLFDEKGNVVEFANASS